MMNSLFQQVEKKDTIESLNFMRGVAACAVMLFHYTATTTVTLSHENPLRMIGVYGYLGVDVFFVLSGFIIPYTLYRNSYDIHSMGRFLARRLIRIDLPYLVIIILEVVFIFVSSKTPWRTAASERLNIYDIFLNAGHLNDVVGRPWLLPIFWTLAIEIQFYFLMAILFPLLLHAKFPVRFAVLFLLMISDFIFTQPYIFFNYSLPFLVGIVTFQVAKKTINMREFVCWLIVLSSLMVVRQGVLPTIVTVLTLCAILYPSFNWKFGGFLGMISYSVYLIHVPFGGRLLALTEILIHSEYIKSLLILLFLGMTIVMAWLFYILVEQPSLGLSKRVFYRGQDNQNIDHKTKS